MSLAFAKALRSLLLSDATVSAALPGGIHPDMIPQEAAFPAAAYTVTSTPISSITRTLPISTADLVLHVRAITPTQVAAVASAVLSVISGQPNQITKHGTIIAGLRMTSSAADVEAINDGDDAPYHTGEINISGWVKED
jgi:hypothetical protein